MLDRKRLIEIARRDVSRVPIEQVERRPVEVAAEFEEDRAACAADLKTFAKAAWPQLEPLTPLVWGWHIDCLLEHMEAVFLGEIRTLIINIPPGHFKSSSVSVLFPAWCWAAGRPDMRFLTGSFGIDLALRDATKSRRLIQSEWFAERWPEVLLYEDQNQKAAYANTLGGERHCFSTGASPTGKHADLLLWDDPLKAADAYNKGKRRKAIEYLTETLPSRFRNPLQATMIIMMQRLHVDDPSGYLLREAREVMDRDTVHVCLPAHFDPNRRMETPWFRDPRKERGDILWPEKFGESALKKHAGKMSDRAKSAQYEQNPEDQAGAIFKKKFWRIWSQAAPACFRIAISFDPAMKEGETTSYWACTVWGLFVPSEAWDATKGDPPKELGDDTNAVLLGAWQLRTTYPEAKGKLLETIRDFTFEDTGPDWTIIENKASGITLLAEFELARMPNVFRFDPGTKSKVERADIASDVFAGGRVWVLGRKLRDGSRSTRDVENWAQEVIDVCASFPGGDSDDYPDSVSQAILFFRNLGLIRVDTDHKVQPWEHEPDTLAPARALYG